MLKFLATRKGGLKALNTGRAWNKANNKEVELFNKNYQASNAWRQQATEANRLGLPTPPEPEGVRQLHAMQDDWSIRRAAQRYIDHIQGKPIEGYPPFGDDMVEGVRLHDYVQQRWPHALQGKTMSKRPPYITFEEWSKQH